jgi:leucyl aminopeptidase
VINTDAEGRLVLADAVWYCRDRFNRVHGRLATCRAIIVALGNDYAGCYANNDGLGVTRWPPRPPRADRSGACHCPGLRQNIDSMVAGVEHRADRAVDLQPCSSGASPTASPGPTSTSRRPPGRSRPPFATIPAGATGFGVRLLNQMVADRFYQA